MHTDVAVIGGGPAGLQAALTLGRVHRDAVLFDDGTYRNAASSHMNNVVGRDGTPPTDFRADARRQLEAYDTVTVREERVESVAESDGTLTLALADGSTVTAMALILATGVRDDLPSIPGIRELWGGLVAHCPFCHGHELAGRRVAILGAGVAEHMCEMMRPIASDLLVLTEGAELAEEWQDRPTVRTERVTAVEEHDGGVRVVLEGAEGEPVCEDVAGLFVKPELRQSAPFAEQLDLELNSSGCVRIDEFGRTSRERVFCAGDMAHLPAYHLPMASVVAAAAAGQVAATSAIAVLNSA
jgi:thioredoxin reductase